MTKRTTKRPGAEHQARDKRDARLERRRADARREILDATLRVLSRDGLAGTTLEGIARELGLTKQAIYYYFDSKEALFVEVCVEEWSAAAREVNAATRAASDAPGALEALVRTYMARYEGRLAVFKLVTQEVQAAEAAARLGREALARFRPLNDLMFGPTEEKLREGQRSGAVPASVHPRRLAFVAHTSAMGLLATKLMVESMNDPLKHSDRELVDELCRALRAAAGDRASARR